MPAEHVVAENSKKSKLRLSTTSSSVLPPRLSFKAGLTVFLSAGLVLFLLSRPYYLLVHTLIEFLCVVITTAVFLISWNTRATVRSPFFVILAAGFLATGLVDLLHTFTYQGMQVLPAANANTATQLWLVARALGACAFLTAVLVLNRPVRISARAWLLFFLSLGGVLVALIWPLGLFPVSYIEGVGLTPFKVKTEYVVMALLLLAALLLVMRRRHLDQRLVTLLLGALAMNILSELLFTWYVDVYGAFNFLGHYCKLGGIVLVYFALIEGTLRAPFATLFREMTDSYDQLNTELQKRRLAEQQQQQASRETAILYHMSRLLHRTLNLDELAHLTLSAVTSPAAGCFERATLFTINRRSNMLQGMLGVPREMAALVLPDIEDDHGWDDLQLDEQSRVEQRTTEYNQKVIKQRLPLDADDNALARALVEKRVVLIQQPDQEATGGKGLATALGLGPYACAPLTGREQVMGVLLVDNPLSRQRIDPQHRRFLELFASQAGSALDNASLVKRLKMAHSNLQDVQEQLIHGEKMAVLGEMAAQVAHELRNPLVSVGGFARRLSRKTSEDQETVAYATIIAREVRRMEEMLNNILAFSKKQLVCLESCWVTPLLNEVIDLEYELCQKRRISIVTEIDETLPEIVGDCRQIRQVFLNLVINARQVMSQGGVLTVRARRTSLRGEEAVRVEIEDTGGGIGPDIIRNIFNPFFSTTPQGTGLGLSISHRIIAQHHGQIEVVNGEHGARFVVVLPIKQPRNADPLGQRQRCSQEI